MKDILISTTQLMKMLDIKSYNTIQRLQNKGVIEPIRIGRNKKWDFEKCFQSIKNYQNEKATV